MPEMSKPTPIKLMSRVGAVVCALGLMGLGSMAAAQNLFAPVARVNDSVVTEFEVQQRQRFLQVLNAPGTGRDTIITTLIEDRLKEEAVRTNGLSLDPEDIETGMTEFAARANLSAEEFITALGRAGISRETFRDFIVANIGWRNLVRARYGSRVQISQAEVDRAMAEGSDSSGIRVLVSEIIIPAPPQNAARVAALADEIAQSTTAAQFSSYARRYSATASRGAGGRLPWRPLEQLPPPLQQILLGLAPGEVSDPLPITNAVALFQLRGIEETGKPKQTFDLYAVAQGQPESVLDRGAKKPSEIPTDIALELAKLDPGESSTALTRANGQTLVFLMLCKRTASQNAEVSQEAAVSQIRQRKLQGLAAQWLEQLRADARITRL